MNMRELMIIFFHTFARNVETISLILKEKNKKIIIVMIGHHRN